MQKIQEKALHLLQEVIDICDNNQLQYFLGPNVLKMIQSPEGIYGNVVNLEVLMPALDLMKFVAYVEHNPHQDRILDYMGNDKYHISLTVEYVDKTTTFIRLAEGNDFSCYGIKIYLIPIRKNVSGMKALFFELLETGWEMNGYHFSKKLNKKRILAAGLARLMMFFGRKNVAKYLFHHAMTMYSYSELKEKDEVVIKKIKKQPQRYSGTYFTEAGLLTFQERIYSVPQNMEDFLEQSYRDFDLEDERKLDYKDTIILENTPYEEFLKKCRQSGHGIEQYFKLSRNNLIAGAFVLKSYLAINQAVLIAKRSGDRLNVYEKLENKSTLIDTFYERKDYEALSEIFMEHEERTRFYLNRRLGFCVCKKYFDIQCELFEWKGEREKVEQLKLLIPKEHYQTIV